MMIPLHFMADDNSWTLVGCNSGNNYLRYIACWIRNADSGEGELNACIFGGIKVQVPFGAPA